MNETVHLADLALEMGETVDRLASTLVANGIPHRIPARGVVVITEKVADQLRSIYANALPETPIRPTPWNLREDFRSSERSGEETEHNYR